MAPTAGDAALAKHLRPGDLMVAAQTLGEPTALLDQLFDSADGMEGLRLFVGMSLTNRITRAPDNIELLSYVGMAANARMVAEGRLRIVPCHMSELIWSLREGPLHPDVALVTVSPPDGDGMCSLGVVADYAAEAVAQAGVVLAEVNDNVPVVAGDTQVPYERFAAVVRSNRPLPEFAVAVPSALERAIAGHVAPLITDGCTIQVGSGRLGEAVLEAVGGRRDLGAHTGMVGDTILEMVRAGVITGARKGHDEGLVVGGSVLGTAKAVALAAEEPSLRLRSIAYTHDASVIGQLERFVCVNSAVEVDLLGQVNSEIADGRQVGGIGGAVDYLRAAHRAPGGRSVVALPATARKGTVSRIVPAVQRVTGLRSDVDSIATEHGLVELRGISEGERAARLIAIAAPEHREGLLAAARRMGL